MLPSYTTDTFIISHRFRFPKYAMVDLIAITIIQRGVSSIRCIQFRSDHPKY